MGVHRTCGEPSEIELAPMGVKLNGSQRVRLIDVRVRKSPVEHDPKVAVAKEPTAHDVGAVKFFDAVARVPAGVRHPDYVLVDLAKVKRLALLRRLGEQRQGRLVKDNPLPLQVLPGLVPCRSRSMKGQWREIRSRLPLPARTEDPRVTWPSVRASTPAKPT